MCSAACAICLATQQHDGSWQEPHITGTGFPGVFYLKYDMYRQNFPLLALATYVNYRSGLGHYPSLLSLLIGSSATGVKTCAGD